VILEMLEAEAGAPVVSISTVRASPIRSDCRISARRGLGSLRGRWPDGARLGRSRRLRQQAPDPNRDEISSTLPQTDASLSRYRQRRLPLTRLQY